MEPVHFLEQPTVWLSTARSVSRGRACRDYVIYGDAGSPLLTAQTSPWQREIVVQTAAEPQHRFMLLRRRLSFPLTGRVDVYDERTRLGFVGRSGKYRDVHGRSTGRFRDARTFGDHAREAALMGVLDALLGGGEGTTAHGSGPSGFVWLVGSQVMGTLGRARLPFPVQDGAGAPADAAATTGRLSALAKRLRALVGPAQPQGWKLERLLPAAPGDPRIVVAAALFAIELSHW